MQDCWDTVECLICAFKAEVELEVAFSQEL